MRRLRRCPRRERPFCEERAVCHAVTGRWERRGMQRLAARLGRDGQVRGAWTVQSRPRRRRGAGGSTFAAKARGMSAMIPRKARRLPWACRAGGWRPGRLPLQARRPGSVPSNPDSRGPASRPSATMTTRRERLTEQAATSANSARGADWQGRCCMSRWEFRLPPSSPRSSYRQGSDRR
jgi:hypothetical protein